MHVQFHMQPIRTVSYYIMYVWYELGNLSPHLGLYALPAGFVGSFFVALLSYEVWGHASPPRKIFF